jgi:hypothetical protein
MSSVAQYDQQIKPESPDSASLPRASRSMLHRLNRNHQSAPITTVFVGVRPTEPTYALDSLHCRLMKVADLGIMAL